MSVKGFCDCYEKHGIKQLAPEAVQLFRKLDNKKVRTLQDLEKMLNPENLQMLQEAFQALEKQDSDFAKCAKRVESEVEEYEEEHEDDFILDKGETAESQHEKAMTRAFQAQSACKHLYYLFLISTKKN
ncbi:MAG: hypothetical protein EAZ95_15755 [Bacteroidetes bacterium]|nr:MAG: hypothetical protein EAZ95_15755 [Bacteroidota bacterium]